MGVIENTFPSGVLQRVAPTAPVNHMIGAGGCPRHPKTSLAEAQGEFPVLVDREIRVEAARLQKGGPTDGLIAPRGGGPQELAIRIAIQGLHFEFEEFPRTKARI